MKRTFKDSLGHVAEHFTEHCRACGMPSDDDVCYLAAQLREQHQDWSSRRCFDRAYIEAAKGTRPDTARRAA